ncbi:MAG: FG-GAP repeat protein [Planctomycetes bacterium]|nr:FG-GAP repeat protein [Planctomycetota bacterium]
METNGNRVSYEWDDTLTEWYINDPRGLEHGYTVHQRPKGAGDRLSLTLAVRGGLRPNVSNHGRDVAFVNANGAAVVNYNGLTVLDADGVALPAWLEAAGDGLRLNVDDRKARYPLTVDPIAQQAYLKASNTGASDYFGCSVAMSGDTVVVGAYGEASNATGVNGNQANNGATNSGAVYVFVRSGEVWSQQAYLKASNTSESDYFGLSLAASGDTVVIGAYLEDSNATGVNGNHADNSATNSGAVYVFVRNGTTWSQQAYLKASNTGAFDNFGNWVAVSGDTVVVGAYGEDSSATGVNGNQADNSADNSGAAYIFVRSGTTWSQQAYLKASNTGVSDLFGLSVAVSGDSVVIGAYSEDSNATGVNGNQADNSTANSGAAYVFVRSGTTWNQQAYLKASNTGADDEFGRLLAVSGDTVVVASYAEDSNATGVDGIQTDNSASAAGAAYVFVRSGTTWGQQAYLKASNTDAGDFFGVSVAVSGDTIVVGANQEDSNATGVDGNQTDNSAANSGAAYIFVRNGTTWSQRAYLKASNTELGDFFGVSVAVSGDAVVVGAYQEDSSATGVNGNQADNSALKSGSAYAFNGVGCPTLGNMNCNCALDPLDIDAFVQALLDPIDYATTHPTCNILRGDMQPDGNVDGADIQGFINLLFP